jgi:hypothetical protein
LIIFIPPSFIHDDNYTFSGTVLQIPPAKNYPGMVFKLFYPGKRLNVQEVRERVTKVSKLKRLIVVGQLIVVGWRLIQRLRK